MHKLVRSVRFSVNPFLAEDAVGFNSFASKPSGEGLAIFLELSIGVIGEADGDTGFVINVTEIDRLVREYAVPIWAGQIRDDFRNARHIGLSKMAALLAKTSDELKEKFGKVFLSELSLKVNPYRKIAIDCEDSKMIYFSEKFEFAAMHKLWNDKFDEEWNFKEFGKCANLTGHGHNYVIEVTVKTKAPEDLNMGEFQKTVDDKLIQLLDHKNLNADVAMFEKVNPTIENIAVMAWDKLNEQFGETKLNCVTIWETDKTHCVYYG